jgi:hypothetical protein
MGRQTVKREWNQTISVRRNEERTGSSLVTWSSARVLHLCINATSFGRLCVSLVTGSSCRFFFTTIRTKAPLKQSRWMVLFELQHTLLLFHVSKLSQFDERLQRNT